ncbi:hypothetical protein HK104_002946, partial [Borealophlyctis nickersoniae]
MPVLVTGQFATLAPGGFSHLFSNSKGADAAFVVEGQEIPVHVGVLRSQAAAPYFESLFTHPMREQLERKVDIKGVSHDVLKGLLEYIYTGRTTVEHLWDLPDLYRAADQYQVTSILPCIKAEIICARGSDFSANAPVRLMKRLQSIPALAEVRRLWFHQFLREWNRTKDSQSWQKLSGDPISFRRFIETFMEDGAVVAKHVSDWGPDFA